MRLSLVLLLAGSYLLGSIPSSYWLAKGVRGVDLRTFGSGNLGATNLYRLMGWGGAIPAGLFDVLKGTAPVLAASRLTGGQMGWMLGAGVAAVLGHVYSPFVSFRGGKGVATSAGVFLALAPKGLLAGLVVFALTLKLTGYVSLGSMLAAAAFLASVALLYPGQRVLLAAAAAVFAFIVFTHRSNVRRLLAGTEARFGHRAKGAGDRGIGGSTA